jgi:hypothetical protein
VVDVGAADVYDVVDAGEGVEPAGLYPIETGGRVVEASEGRVICMDDNARCAFEVVAPMTEGVDYSEPFLDVHGGEAFGVRLIAAGEKCDGATVTSMLLP